MANDIFTGSTSGPAIDWSVGTWSGDNPPTSTDTVEEQGAGVDNLGQSLAGLTVGGLVFDSDASLTVGDGINLTNLIVSGLTDTTFGGANSTLTVASAGEMTVDSSVTSAIGTVNVEDGGEYRYEGSGATQTVNAGDAIHEGAYFFVNGSNNDDNITLQPSGFYWDTGTDNGGTVDLEGGLFREAGTGATTTVNMAGGGAVQVEAAFGGEINHLNTAGQIDVSNSSYGAGSYTLNSNNTVTLNFAGGPTYTLNFDTTANLSVAISGSEFVITSSTPVCFTSGTRIETKRGEVPVEDLAVGDIVVTATGEARPIVWIGRKRIAFPTPAEHPIRVRAGAFGEGLPVRDLRLSPGHAVCVNLLGEVFTPVSGLVNGVSIFAEAVVELTYWHVELESHDVLLAEGLPCESYMDTGNRAFFGREYGRLQTIDPDRIAESLTRYARPFVTDDATVTALRQRLAARARCVASESAAA
jgi:hypothetical protein